MTYRILDKLKNKQLLSFAGNGSMAALSIITYAILYRILSEAEMGNWVFFQFVFVLIDSFRTGFLQTALIKFYSGSSRERKSDIAGSTWYIAIIITTIFALLNIPFLLALHQFNDQGVQFFLQWYGLTLVCTLPFNVAFWVLQAEERFDRILILRFIHQGSFILFISGLFLFAHININTIVYGFLTSSLFTSFIAIVFGWAQISSIRKRTKKSIHELFHFGKYSVGTFIGSSLLRSSDSIIIKFMLGPAALAIYTLAQRVGEIIEILIRSFLGTAMPAMSAAFNKGDKGEVTYIMKKNAGMLTLLLLPVIACTFLLADVFVLLLGGTKYVHTEAANVLRIFMTFAILFPIDRFCGITLDIINKPQLNFIKVLLTLFINTIADIIALKITGNVYGAAAASIITILFGLGFGYFTLRKFLPFNINGIIKLGFDEAKSLFNSLIPKRSIV